MFSCHKFCLRYCFLILTLLVISGVLVSCDSSSDAGSSQSAETRILGEWVDDHSESICGEKREVFDNTCDSLNCVSFDFDENGYVYITSLRGGNTLSFKSSYEIQRERIGGVNRVKLIAKVIFLEAIVDFQGEYLFLDSDNIGCKQLRFMERGSVESKVSAL